MAIKRFRSAVSDRVIQVNGTTSICFLALLSFSVCLSVCLALSVYLFLSHTHIHTVHMALKKQYYSLLLLLFTVFVLCLGSFSVKDSDPDKGYSYNIGICIQPDDNVDPDVASPGEIQYKFAGVTQREQGSKTRTPNVLGRLDHADIMGGCKYSIWLMAVTFHLAASACSSYLPFHTLSAGSSYLPFGT